MPDNTRPMLQTRMRNMERHRPKMRTKTKMKKGYWAWWIKRHGAAALLFLSLFIVLGCVAGMLQLVSFIISLNLSDIQLALLAGGPIAMIIAFIILNSYHTYTTEIR